MTDAGGSATFACLPISPPPSRYMYVAAGTDTPERVRVSDLRIFKLGR
jgi:hypothetical protein